MGFLKIAAIGNVGSVDGLRYTASGKPVLNFSVAVNDGKGDQQTTTWVKCSLWGALAETMADYIVKGKQVYIEGKLTVEEYEGKNGKGFSLKADVREFQLLGSRGDNGERDTDYTSPPVSENIPF